LLRDEDREEVQMAIDPVPSLIVFADLMRFDEGQEDEILDES
jgi:hypothetical protein